MSVQRKLTGEHSRPLPDRSIVLVGLMGAGKSSIGKRLAKSLDLPFFDADAEIERASGLSISEIFSRHGEAYFREGERRVIQRLLAGTRHVLATGGGAFMDPKTRTLIKSTAFSIWLRAELDVLVRRCAKRQNRPLLAAGDPEKILADLMTVRYPIYAEADFVVDSEDGPHELVVEKILKYLQSEGPR